MKPGEVAWVISELEAGVPPARRPDSLLREAFTAELQHLDFPLAMGAVRALKTSAEWFPSWAEFRKAYDSEHVRAKALSAAEHAGDECPECEGVRAVVLRWQPYTVRPCSRCDPIPYQRWAEGHFLPDHSCGECVNLRAGGSAGRDARAAVLDRYRAVPIAEIRRVRAPMLGDDTRQGRTQ